MTATRDRADGYVEEIPYTFGHHPGLAPAHMAFALSLAGIEAPTVRTACELGFGQGVSLAINAVASDVIWHGNDLLAAHVQNIRGLTQGSGARLTVSDETFAEYCSRRDLPRFDFIALHGVWSWVSAENRAHIVRFLRERLAPGGVVYLGYNVSVGWRSMSPLRVSMMREVQRLRAAGASLEESILAACKMAASIDDPDLEVAVRFLRGKSVAYLAHELFNRDWQPMEFGALARCLQEAGLEFAAEARPVDAFASLNFTLPQRAQLDGLDPIAREERKDLFLARKFRRDYFLRSDHGRHAVKTLTPAEREARLRAQRIILVRSRAMRCDETEEDDLVIGASAVRIDPGLVRQVRERLEERGVCTIGDLATPTIAFDALLECIAGLVGRDDVALVAPGSDRTAACKLLNDRLCELSRRHRELTVLASPVCGGGVDVGSQAMGRADLWNQGRRDDEMLGGLPRLRMLGVLAP